MPTIRQLTPTILAPDEAVKIQCWVSLRNKRRCLSAVGDDGVFTFIISHALQQAADFIETNDIKSYDPASFDRFVSFIRDRTDSRPVGHSPVKHDAGAAKSVQHKDAPTPSQSSSTRQGSPGRSGKPAVKK